MNILKYLGLALCFGIGVPHCIFAVYHYINTNSFTVYNEYFYLFWGLMILGFIIFKISQKLEPQPITENMDGNA